MIKNLTDNTFGVGVAVLGPYGECPIADAKVEVIDGKFTDPLLEVWRKAGNITIAAPAVSVLAPQKTATKKDAE